MSIANALLFALWLPERPEGCGVQASRGLVFVVPTQYYYTSPTLTSTNGQLNSVTGSTWRGAAVLQIQPKHQEDLQVQHMHCYCCRHLRKQAQSRFLPAAVRHTGA